MNLETSDKQKIGARFPQPFVSHHNYISVFIDKTTFTKCASISSTPYLYVSPA